MSIKTISTTKLRSSLSDALDSLGKDDVLVISRRGKSEKAIIDLDKLEDLIAANDPSYLKSIKEARESKEVFTHEDVFGDL